MQLYIVRHTRVAVPEGICYGQTDVKLADSFSQEAELVMQNLKGIAFSAVYSSPLLRCRMLAESLKIPLQLSEISWDTRLLELDFGDWENRKWNAFEQSDAAKEWFSDFVNQSCPNGESYLSLTKRVRSFLADLASKQSDVNILIVTHGGVVRAINAILKNIEFQKAFDLKVDYGQILKLTLS